MVQISKELVGKCVAYGVVPATMGALNAGIIALGHTFSLAAKTGLLHGGVIGAVQGIFARAAVAGVIFVQNKFPVRCAFVINNSNAAYWLLGTLLASNIISGIAILVISGLAVKAGIIASSVTIPTIVLLSLANFVLSIGGLALEKFAKDNGSKSLNSNQN